MSMNENTVFHVHTYRCGHAIGTEEEYVTAAIVKGKQKIVFSDHIPFPGDPFDNRMKFQELESYIKELKRLREKYGEIEIIIGLEAEYLPHYHTFYQELLDGQVDFLLLGQHIYENQDGNIKFPSKFKNEDYFMEYGESIKIAAETGFFSVMAHPDKVFWNLQEPGLEAVKLANFIIEILKENSIKAELNASQFRMGKSMPGFFWNKIVNSEIKCIVGCDAHRPGQIDDDAVKQCWNYLITEMDAKG